MACTVTRFIILGLVRCSLSLALDVSSMEISSRGSVGHEKHHRLLRNERLTTFTIGPDGPDAGDSDDDLGEPATTGNATENVTESEVAEPVHECIIGDGMNCKSCVENSTDHNQCASCNSGFHLHGTNCEAYECVPGGAEFCKICMHQSNRTAHQQCASCNSGFELVEKTCQAFNCTVGSGESCQTCVKASHRKGHNECTSCNNGYYMPVNSTSCKAYNCTTGSGTGCQTCVDVDERTDHHQCSACNSGYFLSHTSCEAYNCTTGSGWGCKACVDQTERTGHDQCTSCHKGFALNSTFCEPEPICKEVHGIKVEDTRLPHTSGENHHWAGVFARGANTSCTNSIFLGEFLEDGLKACAEAVASNASCGNYFAMHRDEHTCHCVTSWYPPGNCNEMVSNDSCVYELNPGEFNDTESTEKHVSHVEHFIGDNEEHREELRHEHEKHSESAHHEKHHGTAHHRHHVEHNGTAEHSETAHHEEAKAAGDNGNETNSSQNQTGVNTLDPLDPAQEDQSSKTELLKALG